MTYQTKMVLNLRRKTVRHEWKWNSESKWQTRTYPLCHWADLPTARGKFLPTVGEVRGNQVVCTLAATRSTRLFRLVKRSSRGRNFRFAPLRPERVCLVHALEAEFGLWTFRCSKCELITRAIGWQPDDAWTLVPLGWAIDDRDEGEPLPPRSAIFPPRVLCRLCGKRLV